MWDSISEYLYFPAHFKMIAYQRAKLAYEKPIQNSEEVYMHVETTESQNNYIVDPKSKIKLIKIYPLAANFH